ncbi:uncharacterized protein KY384_003958 [Bacidia gigantensis]|uniref:uncharacterized protein n=1 Tax=Bacidia gigantensis TaxID=2732470 RepID=UPI001D03E1B1|nr:uncharacterized protein KY384_003958 [Bacidia gigantensis]KAG8532317.1 hypothetical protein KY384_003958 [Bacidia gigantensis]
MYGDIDTAEELGYVERGLKARHIQFIAIGGTIGTGLFLGIGRALTQAGPLSLFLGYLFTGIAVYGMVQSLGEMATWLPIPGAIPQFCARYVDGALGFAVGWNSWYSYSLTVAAEVSAASVVIQYWEGIRHINVALWICLILIGIVCLNISTVSVYGEAEFWFASIKIITIVGLILMAFIIDLGGGPKHDRLGFRYWNDPGAMKAFVANGAKGRFLGFFSTLINATFAYGCIEIVAVAGGEVKNPRKNIPKAIGKVFWRILIFYVIGSLAIGVLVPYNEKRLISAIKNNEPGGAASPWVIAIHRAGIPALPSIINACIITSAISSGNAFLFGGSRHLFALAQNGQAPRIFLTCSKTGTPYYCIAATATVALLSLLSCSKGSAQVFVWLQNIISISSLLIWTSVLVAYLKFYYALRAQGIARSTLPYRSKGQPYVAWAALCYFAIIILFNGFWTFPSKTKSLNLTDFVTAYIGLPIYACLYVGWKLLKRTRTIRSGEVDLRTGKAAIDARQYQDDMMDKEKSRRPRTRWNKFWSWLV